MSYDYGKTTAGLDDIDSLAKSMISDLVKASPEGQKHVVFIIAHLNRIMGSVISAREDIARINAELGAIPAGDN